MACMFVACINLRGKVTNIFAMDFVCRTMDFLNSSVVVKRLVAAQNGVLKW